MTFLIVIGSVAVVVLLFGVAVLRAGGRIQ